MKEIEPTDEQREYTASLFESISTSFKTLRPSEWAEESRYLPPQVTPFPGFYRYDVAPYLREIIDCLSPQSSVREVAFMKGAQICATVGILENYIGYSIGHIRSSPVLFVTADDQLANLRVEQYLMPMINGSGLAGRIASNDADNSRKTGKTKRKIEWSGGGFLIPIGARNPAKMRSVSAQVLLCDETDAYVDTTKDGNVIDLLRSRTNAYEATRKVLFLSTPLVKGLSRIQPLYDRGDQRRYYVACLSCGHMQTLRWRRTNNETGEVTGFIWQTSQSGRLVPDSVRYLCENCSHPHTDADKHKLLSPEYGAKWIPTAEPVSPDLRSYHLSALYSPPGMFSWGGCVAAWLAAWDEVENRYKDLQKLQVFYNNVLGEPFEVRGNPIKFQTISSHRRSHPFGQIPNGYAEKYCGGPALVVVCSVDVHKGSLKVGTWAFCRDRRVFPVEYLSFDGDTENVDDEGTWGKLAAFFEGTCYVADDGRRYRLALALVDSGYNTDAVYRFCAQFNGGVFPIKGVAQSQRSARIPEFTKSKTSAGRLVFGVTVDLYKDRCAAVLRRQWDGVGIQPEGHFNAPRDATDAQLKELAAETRREERDPVTGEILKYIWHRPNGAPNEWWDLLIYANAALDLLCTDWSERRGLEAADWPGFWESCLAERLFFVEA
jgi:phage terminase large subunit GpA-like protein